MASRTAGWREETHFPGTDGDVSRQEIRAGLSTPIIGAAMGANPE